MNKSRFAGAAIALMLTACAGRVVPDGFVSTLVTTPNPKLPNVFITEEGGIVVDQEPIRIGKEFVTIVWALPTSSPYYFGADGITFRDPKPEIQGKCSNTEKTFTCTIRLASEMHKYVINPNSRPGADGKVRELRALDPHIMGN